MSFASKLLSRLRPAATAAVAAIGGGLFILTTNSEKSPSRDIYGYSSSSLCALPRFNLKSYCSTVNANGSSSSISMSSSTLANSSSSSITVSSWELDAKSVDDLNRIRPDLSLYTRIDDKADMISLIKDNLNIDRSDPSYMSKHAIYGNLLGQNKIEAYEVYKKNDDGEVKSIIKFGGSLNGYPGVVHGGITALLFDNCFGWLFISMGLPKAVTANLNVNYKKPIFANQVYTITTKFGKLEGRKLTMESNLTDKDGNVLAESSSLFIVLGPSTKT